jgi:hypothetical protein
LQTDACRWPRMLLANTNVQTRDELRARLGATFAAICKHQFAKSNLIWCKYLLAKKHVAKETTDDPSMTWNSWVIRGRLVCLAKRICWFWNMRFAQGCETKIFMRGLLPNVQAVKTVFSLLYILGIYMRCTLFHAIRSDWVRFLSLLSHLFLLSTILRYFTRLCIPLFTTVPYPALHSNNYALLSVPYCVVFCSIVFYFIVPCCVPFRASAFRPQYCIPVHCFPLCWVAVCYFLCVPS